MKLGMELLTGQKVFMGFKKLYLRTNNIKYGTPAALTVAISCFCSNLHRQPLFPPEWVSIMNALSTLLKILTLLC